VMLLPVLLVSSAFAGYAIPNALQGKWDSPVDPRLISGTKHIIDEMSCYNELIVDANTLSNTLYCTANNGTAGSPIGKPNYYVQITMGAEMLACGMNYQAGMARGVLGGNGLWWSATPVSLPPVVQPSSRRFLVKANSTNSTTVATAAPTEAPQVAICAAWSRVSSLYNDGQPSTLWIQFYYWPQDGSGDFGCPDPMPDMADVTAAGLVVPADLQAQLNLLSTTMSGAACQSGPCYESIQSVCQVDGWTPRSDIGIGMSIGNIGMILVTFAMVLILGSVLQK